MVTLNLRSMLASRIKLFPTEVTDGGGGLLMVVSNCNENKLQHKVNCKIQY